MASEQRKREGVGRSGGLSIRIASSIGAFTEDEWDQLRRHFARRLRNALQPVRFLRFSEHRGRVRLRRAQAPAGRAIISGWRTPTARCSARCPATLSRTARANMSSTMAGPTPSSAPAGSYYPKLQASVPFTPATGPRLLVSSNADAAAVKAALAAGLKAVDGSGRRIVGACDLRRGRRHRPRWRAPASCAAPTSSSISSTRAIRPMTISSPRSPRASARR